MKLIHQLAPIVSIVLAALAVACSSSSTSSNAGTPGEDSGGPPPGQEAGGGGDSGGGTDSATAPETGGGGGACTAGSALTTLPACTSAAGTSVAVPSGCAPTVDGTYHSGEWGDAACIAVGSDPVYMKYAGSTLYLAWAMTPTCGCPAQLAFNTDGATTLDGHQFDLGIFDDPNGPTGDSGEFTSTEGAWTMAASVSPGIVIANPPNTPPLVTYEIAIPFSQLGMTAGQAHSVGLGINHPNGPVWPAGLTVPSSASQPTNPGDWGQLTSAANWK